MPTYQGQLLLMNADDCKKKVQETNLSKMSKSMAFFRYVIEKFLHTIDYLEYEFLGYEELNSEAVLIKDYFF